MIEIMGLPGSGKSYLLDKIDLLNFDKMTESVFYNECKKISILLKIKYFFYAFFKFLDVFVILLFHVFLHGSNKIKRLLQVNAFFKYLVLLLCVLKNINSKKKPIFDQAVFQFLWSIDLIGDCEFVYKKYFNYICSKFLKVFNLMVVYYEVDYTLAAKRAIAREKKSEFDYMKKNELIDLYKRHYLDYNVMKKYLKNHLFVVHNIEDFQSFLKNNY